MPTDNGSELSQFMRDRDDLTKEAFERMSFDRESSSMRMPTEMMGDNEFMRNSSAQLLS